MAGIVRHDKSDSSQYSAPPPSVWPVTPALSGNVQRRAKVQHTLVCLTLLRARPYSLATRGTSRKHQLADALAHSSKQLDHLPACKSRLELSLPIMAGLRPKAYGSRMQNLDALDALQEDLGSLLVRDDELRQKLNVPYDGTRKAARDTVRYHIEVNQAVTQELIRYNTEMRTNEVPTQHVLTRRSRLSANYFRWLLATL